jgi:hypothetical protein
MLTIVRVLVADSSDNSTLMTGAIPLLNSTRLRMGATTAITAHMLIARTTTPTRAIVGISSLKTPVVLTITTLLALPMDRNGVVEANSASRTDATLFGVRIAETMRTAEIPSIARIAEVARIARIFETETSVRIHDATTALTRLEAVHSAKRAIRAGSKGTTQGEQNRRFIAAVISMKSNLKETTSTSSGATIMALVTQGLPVPPSDLFEAVVQRKSVLQSLLNAIALNVPRVASMTTTTTGNQNAM